jgi:hypothetical protein
MTTLPRSRIRRLERSLDPRAAARRAAPAANGHPACADPRPGEPDATGTVSMQFDPGHRPALHRAVRETGPYAGGFDLTGDADDDYSAPPPDPTAEYRLVGSSESSGADAPHGGPALRAGPAGGAGPALRAGPGPADRPSIAVGPAAADRPAPADDPAARGGPADDPMAGWQATPDLPSSDEEAFAQDIAAILAHTRSAGSQPARVALPDAPARTEPPPIDPAASKGIGTPAGHDVFDAMAAAGGPLRYDQGPVALAVDFDRLDRALDRVTTQPPPPEPPAQGPPIPEPLAPAGESAPPVPAGDSTAVGPFRVTADVPLLAQASGFTCHAAACASIVGWRDDVVPDPASVASATGYWERYADGRSAPFPDVLDAFGLRIASVGGAPDPVAVRAMLDAHGPLWLAASPPAEHAVVVAGLTGDGTPAGTLVDVVDPWAQGMTTFGSPNPGSRYSTSYADLVRAVAGTAGQIVLAHLKEGSMR